MKAVERALSFCFRVAFRVVCRMDVAAFRQIPRRGAVILAANHTGYLDGPLFYCFIRRDKKTGIAKKELWENPFTGFLMRLWGLIPVDRGGTDRETLRRCFQALEQGYLLGVAPEGTRNKNGVLGTGHPGVVFIAGAKRLPIYPVVHWGTADVLRKLRRFRRPSISVRVGKPFYLEKPGGTRLSAEERTQMLRELMYQMAVLLPPRYRGQYADLSCMTSTFIRYV